MYNKLEAIGEPVRYYTSIHPLKNNTFIIGICPCGVTVLNFNTGDQATKQLDNINTFAGMSVLSSGHIAVGMNPYERGPQSTIFIMDEDLEIYTTFKVDGRITSLITIDNQIISHHKNGHINFWNENGLIHTIHGPNKMIARMEVVKDKLFLAFRGGEIYIISVMDKSIIVIPSQKQFILDVLITKNNLIVVQFSRYISIFNTQGQSHSTLQTEQLKRIYLLPNNQILNIKGDSTSIWDLERKEVLYVPIHLNLVAVLPDGKIVSGESAVLTIYE